MEPRLNGSMTGGLLRKLDGDWSGKTAQPSTVQNLESYYWIKSHPRAACVIVAKVKS